MIPYICEELPDKQKEALASAQKVPLLYTNVAICGTGLHFRNWASNSIYAPGMYHTDVNLDLPVSIGGYECARKPGRAHRRAHDEGARAARAALRGNSTASAAWNSTPLRLKPWSARFASNWRARLGPGGFDPARDIAAITVNRWPHGYAYEYNSLFDSFWLEGGETPCEVARKPYGRIAIANSDAGAYAYTDEAINQAWRAVGEITKG